MLREYFYYCLLILANFQEEVGFTGDPYFDSNISSQTVSFLKQR